MSAHPPEREAPPTDDSPYDDESGFDVRPLVRVVARRWRFVRDLVLVVTVIAVAVVLLTPRAHLVRAGVAIVKARTQVSFDPKIVSLSPEATGQSDQTVRRNTLANLVSNPKIAEQVIADLGDGMPYELREPDRLTDRITGSINRGAADMLDIQMEWTDEAAAVAIVSAWATRYERFVNGIYATGISQADLLDKERASSKAQYDQALSAYLAFAGSNRVAELTRTVDNRKRNIEALQRRADVDRETLSGLYVAKHKLRQTLEDARTLRDQAARPGSSPASTSLAVTLLKTQIAAASPQVTAAGTLGGLQLQVNIQSTGDVSSAQLADLDALVQTIEDRSKQVDAEIDARTAAVLKPNPLQPDIDRLQKEMMEAESLLARENATGQELVRARDQAWETYASLSRKVDERTIAQQVGGTEVVYAVPARVVNSAALTKRLTPVVTVFVVSLVLGIVVVAGLEIFSPDRPTPQIPWSRVFGRLRGQR